MRSLRGSRLKFKHNDIDDLKRRLDERARFTNKLIVTEGVYCLEGEIIDVPAYVEVAREYGAKLMIDDAHAIGVIGSRGGGSPDYHDCADGIDILMGCMDKALGGTGGYLCGSKTLVDFLRIAANSSVLSSALPCSMAAAVVAAIDLIENGDELRAGLVEKSRYLKAGLREAGFTVLGPERPAVGAAADRRRTAGARLRRAVEAEGHLLPDHAVAGGAARSVASTPQPHGTARAEPARQVDRSLYGNRLRAADAGRQTRSSISYTAVISVSVVNGFCRNDTSEEELSASSSLSRA